MDKNLAQALGQISIPDLARKLGISRQAVHQWTQCPPKHVLTLEAMSGVPRHHIRPDIYPAPEQDGEAA